MLKNSTAFLALLVALLGFTAEAVNNHVFVRCETTKGPLTIEVSPEWASIGATRFLDLVYDGFYTDIALFRSVDKFLTQFGISDKPEKQHLHTANIPDDINLNFGIIDDMHHHAAVPADMAARWAKLWPCGLLAGHDYLLDEKYVS